MHSINTTSRSRSAIRPKFAINLPDPPIRGSRECRVRAAPAVSRAIGNKEKRTRAYRFSGSNPAFPAQWFYGLFRALPGDRALLPPSPLRSLLLRNLTPASGRQDHTSLPSASTPFVIGASASTASRPASVTIANRPFVGRDGEGYRLIWVFGKSEYFFKRGWTRDNRKAS